MNTINRNLAARALSAVGWSMGQDDMGDDILGDDILGDDILGDDILGDDILGDDILGDDLLGALANASPEALLGLRFRRRQKVRRMDPGVKQALIQNRIRHSMQLRKTVPTKGREQLLGFFFAAIPAGATRDVISRPQTIFRGERLVIPAALVGVFFSIEDIKVGNVSQFVASGPVPAVTFSEQGVGVRLALDTAQPAMDVALRVTNLDVAPHDFRASLIGGSAQ